MKTESSPIEFFISPNGNDRWSGRLPESNRRRTDGPFATIERARDSVRRLKIKGELRHAVRVCLRGGVYELRSPLVFTPEDSGSPSLMGEWNDVKGPEREVTYAAYRRETPILSGGHRITDWKETTVHDRRAWVAHLPEVARGRWYFTQLWVNGRRAIRPRLPRQGYFRVEKLLGEVHWKGSIHKALFTGQDRFRFTKGDLANWRNVRDVEFVALHYWIESRIPFQSIDPRTREARLQWKPRMRLTDDHTQQGAQYYVENVFEALAEPGEWYLDRPTGKLYYLPRPGEKITTAEVFAPRLKQLVVLRGDAEAGKPVHHLHFRGLTFSHSEWVPGEEAHTATPQAACHIPGALSFQHARDCSVRGCRVEHIGSYGIELNDGCSDVDIVGNRIADLAGGGVKVWHSMAARTSMDSETLRSDTVRWTSRRAKITDNEICDGGHRWRQAVGVLIGKCSANQVLHNHIHDFDYTGVSVGWTWGYAESLAYGNIIEHNHIHHIGRGVLSDMGGIYTLGVSPGTRLRFNLIHDIESRGYGGWGIYTDEGSSDILIEYNLVFRTKSAGFHQHYGRENILRNNIFAFGREAQFTRSRLEPHDSFTLTGNIFYADNDGTVASGNWKELRAVVDRNLYYHAHNKRLRFAGKNFEQWQRRGLDRHGLIRDPRFVNPARGDFRLKPGSATTRIGFVPFDLSNAGPRRNRKL
jgi:hypothetical protein